MKTIRNKTFKPVKLTFSDGKVLHLGPGKTGQIPDAALERKSVKALIQAETIEVLDAGPSQVQGADTSSGGPHEMTRGHKPAMTGASKGQRGS